jgi:hypothetical protein
MTKKDNLKMGIVNLRREGGRKELMPYHGQSMGHSHLFVRAPSDLLGLERTMPECSPPPE